MSGIVKNSRARLDPSDVIKQPNVSDPINAPRPVYRFKYAQLIGYTNEEEIREK